MKHLADDFVTVVESPDPQNIYCYSPGILKLESGRIIATMDFGGPGVINMQGYCHRNKSSNHYNIGKVLLSDDDGRTWRETVSLPMLCMRPFIAGKYIYIIGFCEDLRIVRSEDNGESWSEICSLTQDQYWHQAPSNVWYEKDNVYMVMERMTHKRESWPVCGIAPVLMRGNVHTDLTERANWTFASELVFDEHIEKNSVVEFGIPFYPNVNGGYMSEVSCGWLETNVVRLKKENDWFYDETGHTFHLFMRAWTGLAWTGALAKVVEKENGSMETMFETAPSGKRMLFVNIPGGGQSKFHILYDEQTKTYWLLSNQFIDSMVDFNRMDPNDRKGYDRSRLILSYSYNCFNWIFAGVVAAGNTLSESRSYASMQITGDDLIILSRTGNEKTLNGHDTNLITFHKVANFRSLIDMEYKL